MIKMQEVLGLLVVSEITYVKQYNDCEKVLVQDLLIWWQFRCCGLSETFLSEDEYVPLGQVEVQEYHHKSMMYKRST